ncbi:MAG: hypothetical protein K2W97_04085 [Chthoniobacterales bacterium]|nr:hypothetical protein [Chthoniobacterales bacterium]
MKNFHLSYLFTLLIFLLSGCVTLHRPNEQLAAVLSSYHVPQETYDKMIYEREIDYSDIMNLEKSKVPTSITTKYLNDYNTECMRERMKSEQEDMKSDQEWERTQKKFAHDAKRDFKKFEKRRKF